MRKGDWIQTFTGVAFYPQDPRVSEVVIEDIAHSLSQQCRYNGHIKRFYSVAEHCLHLSYAVSEENALMALLHDASEAYIGDLVRPVKDEPKLKEFKEIENRLFSVIAEALVPGNPKGTCIPAEVNEADTRILWNEKEQCFHTKEPQSWELPYSPLKDVVIRFHDPFIAEMMYLERYRELYLAQAVQHCGK